VVEIHVTLGVTVAFAGDSLVKSLCLFPRRLACPLEFLHSAPVSYTFSFSPSILAPPFVGRTARFLGD
jgi:hypothetical protein